VPRAVLKQKVKAALGIEHRAHGTALSSHVMDRPKYVVMSTHFVVGPTRPMSMQVVFGRRVPPRLPICGTKHQWPRNERAFARGFASTPPALLSHWPLAAAADALEPAQHSFVALWPHDRTAGRRHTAAQTAPPPPPPCPMSERVWLPGPLRQPAPSRL
jgi:hypothetical protein